MIALSSFVLVPREQFEFIASEKDNLIFQIKDEGSETYKAMASIPIKNLNLSRGAMSDWYPVLNPSGFEVPRKDTETASYLFH